MVFEFNLGTWEKKNLKIVLKEIYFVETYLKLYTIKIRY